MMTIPVFLASDDNYAPYLSVTIKSICENTTSNINFYILDSGIDYYSKKYINDIISEYKNCNLEYISIDKQNIFCNCIEKIHYTKAVYLRLLIPEIKPEIKKTIYLDVDIIVNIDIKELYNEDLNENIIGAVYEECLEPYHFMTSKKNLKIDQKHKYFNSGVLVIDCEKWRENKITSLLYKLYDEFKDNLFYPDQDLLNIAFSINKYKILDKKYNYISQNPYTEDRVIYHYDGRIKPWEISDDLKSDIINYIDIWWKYAQKTPCLDIIKDKCKYKDKISFRVARAKKAHDMLDRNNILKKYREECNE